MLFHTTDYILRSIGIRWTLWTRARHNRERVVLASRSQRDKIQEFCPGISISFVQLPFNRSLRLSARHRFVAGLPLRISILSARFERVLPFKKTKHSERERENSFSSRWSNSRFKKGKQKQNKVLSTSRNFPNTKLFPRNRANDKRRSVTSPKEQSYSSPRGTRQARIDKAIGGENRGKNEEKEAEGETEGRSRRLASY